MKDRQTAVETLRREAEEYGVDAVLDVKFGLFLLRRGARFETRSGINPKASAKTGRFSFEGW
jgi:hypothetical protein